MADPRKTNRREFLAGHSAIEALADLTHGNPLPPPAHTTAAERHVASGATYLVEISRTAMACDFQIFLNAGQHRHGPDVALETLDLVEALEDQLTVYRPHSEVSRLNDRAAREPVMVERRLFDLLTQAAQLSTDTAGAFDITAGPLSKLWGFYRRAGRFPGEAEIHATLLQVGSQWLEFDPAAARVRYQRPGLEINLGAIGKGYALDRSAEVLLARGVENFLMHGGQSSILGRGSRAGVPEGSTGWRVALRHPLRPGQRLAEFWLRDRALGTSGSGNQFFYHAGRRYGHILDPRSGWPAEAVVGATVLAPTAAAADALATAFFVLGIEKASAYCAAHPDISALLVGAGDRSGTIELHAMNLAADDWQACN